MIRTWALFAVLISGALLQEPVLGAADSERRNCPGLRGVLSEVPEASMSAAAAMRAFNASGKVQARPLPAADVLPAGWASWY